MVEPQPKSLLKPIVWNKNSFVDSLADQFYQDITPQKLKRILYHCQLGDDSEFLRLAEKMEQTDPHYAAVLQTRRLAVLGSQLTVIPASETPEDREIAEQLRQLCQKANFINLIEHLLSSISRGFAIAEIIWGTHQNLWLPKHYKPLSPHYFCQKEDQFWVKNLAKPEESTPLLQYKFIVHRQDSLGVASCYSTSFLSALSWLCKSFAVKQWMSFLEGYGMPIRVGKYHPTASEEDKRALKKALLSLVSDAAGILPDSMQIEFQEVGGKNANADFFSKLLNWLDRQISKAVLGQTMTTDEGASFAQAQVHDKVRQDIVKADARKVSSTLNQYLVEPFVKLNWGEHAQLPELALRPVPSQETNSLVEALKQLVPLGLQVEESAIRQRFGLPEPKVGASLLKAQS